MTLRYSCGFSTRTASMALTPCAWKSSCSAAMKCSPSLLREPFGRPAGLPDFPGSNGRPMRCCDAVPSASLSLIETPAGVAPSRQKPQPELGRVICKFCKEVIQQGDPYRPFAILSDLAAPYPTERSARAPYGDSSGGILKASLSGSRAVRGPQGPASLRWTGLTGDALLWAACALLARSEPLTGDHEAICGRGQGGDFFVGCNNS